MEQSAHGRLANTGDKRIRTADISRAKTALYQLSYIPTGPTEGNGGYLGYPGLEPGTSPLSGVRSNQLS